MNRSHVIPYEERVRLRREYLAKVATASTIQAVGACVAIVFGSFAVFFTLLFVLVSVLSDASLTPKLFAGFAGIFGMAAAPAAVGGLVYRFGDARARSISFVPRVGEQIASLPDREILVRGSAQSQIPADDLVRPVKAAISDSSDLLRTSDSADHAETASGIALSSPRM
jgi:hypothetical protein